jgi:hypothetical protein
MKNDRDEKVKGALSPDLMRRYKTLDLTKDIAIPSRAEESVQCLGGYSDW